jgi:hypothetical protein
VADPTSTPITYAILPGFPRPEAEGARYEAEKDYVRSHGLPRPILVDRIGVIWSGRTLMNVCCDLGIEPVLQVVEDGHAAAVLELATRDLSVLEWADLVLAVYDNASTKFVLENAPKRSVAVSGWIKASLGKERGFSPSQVEQFLRVARSPAAIRKELSVAKSLGGAVRILKRLEDPAPAPIAVEESAPTVAETAAMQAASAFMESAIQVEDWTESGREILFGLRIVLNGILRAGRSRAPAGGKRAI